LWLWVRGLGVNAIFIALNDYFPGELGGFLKRNLVAMVESRGPCGHFHPAALLITANGIFLPVEVAQQRLGRETGTRTYFRISY
jgi:membrane protein/epoxyqueuosine reductase